MLLIDVFGWATDVDRNATLKKQLAAAIANAAVQILAEPETTYNHERRVTWARSVLASPDAPAKEADQMIWGVLGNTTIQGELGAGGTVPDSDLQFTTNSLVDTYA